MAQAISQVLTFFRSMKSVALRFETKESVTQLQMAATPIVLNFIDGYLCGRGSMIADSDDARSFQERLGIDRPYLSNVVSALGGFGFLDRAGGTTDDLINVSLMAGGSLIDLLGASKSDLLEHSRPLDVHTWSDHPEVNAFVNTIYRDHFGVRQSAIKKKHLKVVLLDLYVAWSVDPSLKTSISRDGNAYPGETRYNKLHITKKTIGVVDRLEQVGLIRQAIGFFDRATGNGRQTRIWPTGKLVEMFEDAKFEPYDIDACAGREVIVLNEFSPKKPGNTVDVEYVDTPETNRMRKVVEGYNDLLRRTFIDIPMLEYNFIELGDGGKGKRLFVSQRDKFTRRVFNRGSFDKGGRFYGGWWQRCPKEWRKKLFIDDQPVHELDYSGLHIIMLYANERIDYWSEVGVDPYVLENPPAEIEPFLTRNLCKDLLLMAINATTEKKTFQAFRDESPTGSVQKSLSNTELAKILNLLKEKHKFISHKFGSDAGISLMNQDARITELIVEWFTGNELPILAIHDGYIVPLGLKDELDQQMREAFAAVTGMASVRIKVETHDPDDWEPLDLDSAFGLDFTAWELARKDRHDPPRSKRYLHEREQFEKWLGVESVSDKMWIQSEADREFMEHIPEY